MPEEQGNSAVQSDMPSFLLTLTHRIDDNESFGLALCTPICATIALTQSRTYLQEVTTSSGGWAL